MRRILKWLMVAMGGLAAVAVAVAVIGYLMLRNTVAPMDGRAQIAGLSAPVRIVKDAHAIPHIEAENRLDAVRALGWVHASERLWQMEVLRMAGQGRLAEMFGAEAVSSDRFLRTLGIAGAAQASHDVLSPETRAVIEAYVGGINAWITRERGVAEPALPVEFIVLGHQPEPWQGWHSVSLLKVMALTLDTNMDEEIGRLALAGKRFTSAMIEEIYPANERDEPPPLPDLARLYGFDKEPRAASASPGEGDRRAEPATAPWTLQLPASNNWAIAPQRSETGKALLANDPHLGLTVPSTFYLAHLAWQADGSTRNLVGGTLPGVPLMLIGRNDHVGWGMTTTYLDSQDLFLEQLNPDNPGEYRTQDGYAAFEVRSETLRVSGGEEIALDVRMTRHGPVLPAGYRDLETLLPKGHVAALAWTGLSRDDTTFDALLAMGDARNMDDLLDAARLSVSPMQSLAAADSDGNVALIAVGRMVQRSPANLIAGRAPVPGWNPIYAWEGFVDPADTPRIINPAKGAVASANSNWLPAGYPNHVTYDWAEDYRQKRVEELFVDSSAKQSVATMIAGQTDRYSPALVLLRDRLLRALPQGVRLDAAILDAVRRWDGTVRADSPIPLILNAWHRELLPLMLRDELRDDFGLFSSGHIARIAAMLDQAGRRDWCDKSDTPERESCGDIVFEAGEKALGGLREAHGADWQAWRWGDVSRTMHEHRPFTQVGALSDLFTLRAEMDGGKYTLLRNSNNLDKAEPFAGVHGSALRVIYDFADLDRSLFMISTGQSGNVMSPHYRDLNARWARLEYLSIPTDPDRYRAEAAGVFELYAGR